MSMNINRKRSNKFLSIVYENKQSKKDNQFIRSYSQLLNRHFSQSMKQKSSLRRTSSSSHGFKTKKHKSSSSTHNHKQQTQTQNNKQLKSTNNNKKQSDIRSLSDMNNNNMQIITIDKSNNINFKNNLSLSNIIKIKDNYMQNKSLIQSINDDNLINLNKYSSRQTKIVLNQQRQTKIVLNPQTNQKIQSFLLSKTQLLSQNSYHNVVLNHQLHSNNQQKKSLISLIDNLKLNILKQKKKKSKISNNMGKLMNKIQQTNEGIRKIQQQRFYIKQQTNLLQKEFYIQQRKRQQLQRMSMNNRQKMRIQNELINNLYKDIQRIKTNYYQARTHLNEMKGIYMKQSRCQMKMQINYNQIQNQRDLMCKVVQDSVIKTKYNQFTPIILNNNNKK